MASFTINVQGNLSLETIGIYRRKLLFFCSFVKGTQIWQIHANILDAILNFNDRHENDIEIFDEITTHFIVSFAIYIHSKFCLLIVTFLRDEAVNEAPSQAHPIDDWCRCVNC